MQDARLGLYTHRKEEKRKKNYKYMKKQQDQNKNHEPNIEKHKRSVMMTKKLSEEKKNVEKGKTLKCSDGETLLLCINKTYFKYTKKVNKGV